MSSRQLKKITGYDETEALRKAMGLTDADLAEKPKPQRKPKAMGFSAFDLLEDDDDQTGSETEEKPEVVSPQSNKKKKKKKKKKNNQTENKPEQKTQSSPQKEESFDDIIEKYGFKNTLSKEEEFELSISKKSFLSIETKFLDPDAELKRIFGSAAVNVDRNNRRNQHQPRRGGILVSQARVGHLPGGTGGLGCKDDERKKQQNSDVCWWKFTHNRDYQMVQSAFLAVIKSHEHEALMAILQKHPCHVDSLLALSDACRLQDDSTACKELLERLLHVMESSLHPRCVISSGKNRFDYARPENRPFFGALFRYALLSARRGCWRTALEQAKLLLSLDPESDPLAAVLLLPLFSVRSGRFEELLQMKEELSYRHVNDLPNWSLSVALAYIQLNKEDLALKALEECLKKFPGLLLKLLEAMQAEPCPEIQTSPFFNVQEEPGKKILYDLLCKREVELWKETKAQSLLQKASENVLKMNLKVPKPSNRTKIPPQIARHAILCEQPIANLRPDQSFLFDPVPPNEPVIEYTPELVNDGTGQISGHGSLHELFLQSLIPGFENRMGENNIRAPIQNLIDSMSSLLEQLRTVPGDVPETNDLPEDDEFD